MKRLSAVLLAVCALLLFAGCSSQYEEEAYQRGLEAGYKDGYEDGKNDALDGVDLPELTSADLDELLDDARSTGYDEGYSDGYNAAWEDSGSYEVGFEAGYDEAYSDGYDEGYAAGKADGYSSGYADGQKEQQTFYAFAGDNTSESAASSRSGESRSSMTVYVSKNGVIHQKSNCSGMKHFTEMTYAEAIAAGYRLCSKCW